MIGSSVRRAGSAALMAILLAMAACAPKQPVPPAGPPPPAALPDVPIEQKVAWLLRLEQQRVLRDTGAAAVPAGTSVRVLAPARVADLEALAIDPDVNVRRRALLGIGRVGLREGIAALTAALGDPKETEEIRAVAAFALGLVGSADANPALLAALKESSPLIRGRASEALGLIGDVATAGPIADAASGCAPLLGAITGDDEPVRPPALEACRLALFALVRLRQYDALVRVALDPQGNPVSHWWPVAYALQRIEDPRTAGPLTALLASPGVHTPAFAFRGLATARDPRVVTPALTVAADPRADVRLRVAAVRALGAVGGKAAIEPLVKLIDDPATPRNLTLEAVTALTAIGDPAIFDLMLDLLTDPWPAMRSAAMAAAAKVNPDDFLLVISNFERDRDWSVRANLATVLATLPGDRVRAAIQDLVGDNDVRVRGPALEALARIGAPDLATALFDALETPDFAVRAVAARLIGEQKVEGGPARLIKAYERGESDVT